MKHIRISSLTSLILMTASAIVATFISNQFTQTSGKYFAGSLTNNSKIPNVGSSSSITCAPDTLNGGIDNACNVSTGAGSESTADLFGDSTSISSLHGTPPVGDGGLGGDNTSDAS